jgi:hypothetical protein
MAEQLGCTSSRHWGSADSLDRVALVDRWNSLDILNRFRISASAAAATCVSSRGKEGDFPFRRNYTSDQFSFSESNGAIESFEQDNGSADGDSDTEKRPNQKIFGETHGLEFRIARNRFCSKNESDGGGRL